MLIFSFTGVRVVLGTWHGSGVSGVNDAGAVPSIGCPPRSARLRPWKLGTDCKGPDEFNGAHAPTAPLAGPGFKGVCFDEVIIISTFIQGTLLTRPVKRDDVEHCNSHDATYMQRCGPPPARPQTP